MLNKKKTARERQSKSVKEKKKENVQRVNIRNDGLYEQTKDKRTKKKKKIG
jgi:hypothetical protein